MSLIPSPGDFTSRRKGSWKQADRNGLDVDARKGHYEIWKYCQRTSRLQAQVLQNLMVGLDVAHLSLVAGVGLLEGSMPGCGINILAAGSIIG